MLLHVNPAEVKGLASAMPITVNPETGQPEAFLPFLAPLAGSLLGGSLLGGALGSTLLGSAVGSGLAQYAVTGDLKKGLLAGLTGYGLGTAMQGAGAAKAGADATAATTQAATEAATKTALTNAANLNITDPTLLNIASTDPTLASQLGAEALNPAGQLAVGQQLAMAQPAIAQAGKTAAEAYTGTGVDALKDAFTGNTIGEGFGNLATGLADPMAYIPAGIGMGGTGIMESQEAFARMVGESEEAYRRRREQNLLDNPEPILYSAGGGPTGYFMGGDVRAAIDSVGGRDITGGNLPQIYAPAKQAYDVNPDFMAGFSPETMYFNPATISAPASGLQAGAPPIGIDTYEGSKGGYGGRQASIAPQVSIDPYSAYTGSAPKGLEFTEAPMPEPIQPMPVLPRTPPDFGIGVPDIGRIDIPNIGNIDIQSIIDQYGYDAPERAMTGADLGLPMGKGTPMPAGTMMQANDLGALLPPGTDNGIDISDFLGSREDNLAAAQAMFGPQVTFATGLEPSTDSGMGLGLGEMMTAEELIARGGTPQPRGSGLFGKGPIVDSDVSIPTNFMIEPPVVTRKEGGKTLKPIPEDNKGLPNLPKDVRNEMGYMQAGGMTEMQNDPLTQEVTMFILGETDNEQALNDFITKYGSDTFMQLREAVLQSIVPNAQTEGLIRGDGEGGMDDDLRGMIGGKERIAVSQDEFIVPADVVSMLGDGSSDAGSKELYDMMDRVRKEKTGTTKQAPRLANAGGLLPA
jgi:hypothetical protein